MNENTSSCPAKTPRRWRWLRRFLLTLVVLGTLVALFYAEENWRGIRSWQRYKAELTARGEKLDWNDFIPPPIPDASNVFKAPFMEAWQVSHPSWDVQTNQVWPKWLSDLRGDWEAGEFTPFLERQIYELEKKSRATTGAVQMVTADLAWLGTNVSFFPYTNLWYKWQPVEEVVGELARGAGWEVKFEKRFERYVYYRRNRVEAPVALTALLHYYQLEPFVINAERKLLGIRESKDSAPKLDEIKLWLEARTNDLPLGTAERLPFLRIEDTDWMDTVALLAGISGPGTTSLDFIMDCWDMYDTNVINIEIKGRNESGDGVNFGAVLERMLKEKNLWLAPMAGQTNVYMLRKLTDAVALAEVEKWRQTSASELRDLETTLQRPLARVDVDYQIMTNLMVPWWSINAPRQLGLSLAALASGAISQGKGDEAEKMFYMELRLAEVSGSTPTLVSAMIYASLVPNAIQPVWEGIVTHQWNEAQLQGIQRALQRMHLIESCREGIRAERAYFTKIIESLPLEQRVDLLIGTEEVEYNREKWAQRWKVRWAPSSWAYRELEGWSRQIQGLLDALPSGQSFLQPLPAAGPDYVLFANYTKALLTAVKNQAYVNLAVTACALERYRLREGAYPEALTALVPAYLEKLPVDLITGNPLHYRRTENGEFLLYGVGLDQKNDGGVPISGRWREAKGDWGWRFPER